MSRDTNELRSHLNALHECLLRSGGDEVREQLATCLLPRLKLAIRIRLPGIDVDTASDAASDAILKYLQSPAIYEPSRSRLDTFLAIVAVRLAIDMIRRELRRHANEASVARASIVMTAAEDRDGDLRVIEPTRLCKTSEEWRFLEAWVDGERTVARLASLLGGDEFSEDEQRRLVKRTTERLRMRARRALGAPRA